MKCIKLKVVPTDGADFQTLDVTIVEQTSRNSQFGANGSDKFTASNGVVLRSVSSPERIGNALFYVRGHGIAADNNVVKIPTSLLPDLKQAVKEYNQYFAVPQNKCSIVIG
jgi:hypothetical protein